MLKYLYYVWNLLKEKEQRQLFNYFGLLIIAAFLLTVVDWQYYILFGFILQAGATQVFKTVVATQLIVWMVNLWYYYLKYRLLIAQNSFYKIISNRHYEYTLERISRNGSLEWIGQKSIPELTKQLDSSDRGLQIIFTFMGRCVRSGSMILINLMILGMTYSYSILFLIPTLLLAYVFVKNDHLINDLEDIRGDYKSTQQKNFMMISDNLSTLFDEVVSGNYLTMISNILSLNRVIKGKQNRVTSSEDRMYTKLSLTVISGYLVMMIFSFISVEYQFEQLCMYVMTMFLSYKSLNTHLNSICDAYYDLRQAEMDFDTLGDVWTQTKETRPDIDQQELTKYTIQLGRITKFYQMIYSRIERELIDIYRSYIVERMLAKKFRAFKLEHYPTEVDNIHKLQVYHNFICSLPKHFKRFNQYYHTHLEDLDLPTVDDLYVEYMEDCLVRKPALFSFSLKFLAYQYQNSERLRPFRLTFTEETPILLRSNTHLLVTGVSGSGKSTLMKIIRGILPVPQCESHSVEKNGIELGFIDENNKEILTTWMNLSNQVGYCRQNSISFVNGTVFQILTGDFCGSIDDYDEKDIQKMKIALTTACVDVQFHDLDYQLSASMVSGGQRQRLTVAKHVYRVLQNDYKIVILDEIDAGLDSETAKRVIFNLRILFADRMLITVLHTTKLAQYFERKIQVVDGVIKQME